MDGYTTAAFLAAHVNIAAAALLWWHDKYNDGVLGRIALGAIALASGYFILEGYGNTLGDVMPATAIETCAIALFLTRHVCIFLRFNRAQKRNILYQPVATVRRRLGS